MEITTAAIQDAETILGLQKLAYQSEAAIYHDFSIPPLRQTLEELQNEWASRVVLKAMLDGRIVGSVRAWEKNGTCFIERLIVHPQFQDRGIGSHLMNEMEMRFTTAQRFELFTGQKSERNIRLYKRLGYKVFRQERINNKLTFVFMEKRRKKPQ